MTNKMLEQVFRVKKARRMGNLIVLKNEKQNIEIHYIMTCICAIDTMQKKFCLIDEGYNTIRAHKHIVQLYSLLIKKGYRLEYIEVHGECFHKNTFTNPYKITA